MDKNETFGLMDELSGQEISKSIQFANYILEKNGINDKELNLKKDDLTVPGQNYVTVSWIGPSFKAKTSYNGFRIMGAFDTLEEASKYAVKINKMYPRFDTGVMQMNHFCLGYPDPSDTQESVDDKLNEFIVDHKTKKEYKKQLFEARKEKLKNGSTKVVEFDTVEFERKAEFKGKMTDKDVAEHMKHVESLFNKKDTRISEIQKDTRINEIIELSGLDVEGGEGLDMTPCNTKVLGQEYALVTYVGNTGKNERIPINIRGVFESAEKAESHIEQIMSIDDTYDVVVTQMYCWVPCDPDTDSVKRVYPNEKLNNLFESHQNENINTKSFHNAVVSSNEDVLSKVTIPENKGVAGFKDMFTYNS